MKLAEQIYPCYKSECEKINQEPCNFEQFSIEVIEALHELLLSSYENKIGVCMGKFHEDIYILIFPMKTEKGIGINYYFGTREKITECLDKVKESCMSNNPTGTEMFK